jgi:hypothetical protein
LALHQQPVAEEMKVVHDCKFEGEDDFLLRMLQVPLPLGPQEQVAPLEKTFVRQVSPSETYSKIVTIQQEKQLVFEWRQSALKICRNQWS